MTTDWKNWETCEWQCTCGHTMSISFQKTSHASSETGIFKTRCNNCTMIRKITITDIEEDSINY